jgi:hypothetical protein
VKNNYDARSSMNWFAYPRESDAKVVKISMPGPTFSQCSELRRNLLIYQRTCFLIDMETIECPPSPLSNSATEVLNSISFVDFELFLGLFDELNGLPV